MTDVFRCWGLLLGTVFVLAFGSGCATDVDADSPSLLPWNEPAGFESGTMAVPY